MAGTSVAKHTLAAIAMGLRALSQLNLDSFNISILTPQKCILFIVDASEGTVVSENREKFQIQYQAGKIAFERGEYRQTVQYLEAAQELIESSSRLGGEAQIWLVTAYQAAAKEQKAIALCQALATHPHLEIRQQSQRLLYIMQAPQLKRPKEWMSEIPDLASSSEGKPKYVTAKSKTNSSSSSSDKTPKPVDLSQVNTKDNQFIGVALVFILLIFLGLFWLN